jgi:hypothetical protein
VPPVPHRRALLLVALLSVLLVGFGTALILSASGPERLGDNGRVGSAVGGFLDPGHRRSCTTLRDVPKRAQVARLIAVAVDSQGEPLRDAALRAGTRATLRAPGDETRQVRYDRRGEDLRIALDRTAVPDGTRLCLRYRTTGTRFAISLRGVGPDPLARDAAFGVIYERAGSASWFSRAGGVLDRVAPGRPAHQGEWTAWLGLLLIALAALGGIAVAWAAVAGRLGHGRRALVAVALVAVASASSWALIVPPLQTPDSESHLSYVAHVAHHGGPVEDGDARVSSALAATQRYTREHGIRFVQFATPPLRQVDAGPRPPSALSDADGGVVANAQGNPLLYYAAAAVPYRVTGAGPFGGELWVRLLSALLFGVTAAGVVLFLREALPGTPRLAAVGGLLVALLPQVAFISGSVNPDAMLFAFGSLVLWRIAHAFRHGLDVRGGLLLGGLLAAASLSKLAGLMLVPSAAIALLALLWRARGTSARAMLPAMAAAGGLFAALFLVYQGLSSALWSQGTTGGGQAGTIGTGSLREELSYVWQFFLPRLPSMTPLFDGSPLQFVYVREMVGVYGWKDVVLPSWAYELGRTAFWVIVAAAGAFLVRRRDALRGRVLELLAYAASLGAFLLLIAHLGYRYRVDLDLQRGREVFEQVRYLFPLLALWAAVLVAALRLTGRRVAPYLAIVVVGLAGLHSIASILATMGRYYG